MIFSFYIKSALHHRGPALPSKPCRRRSVAVEDSYANWKQKFLRRRRVSAGKHRGEVAGHGGIPCYNIFFFNHFLSFRMSVKTVHELPNELYFCTFTCTNWLSLFEITQSYDEVYKWLLIAHKKSFRTCSFVIMPNHLHFIMATPFGNANLNTLVSNGKRFLAYEIVERLKNSKHNQLLKQLENEVTRSDKKRGKLHQVFKPSFDARLILDEKMLFQKMDYLPSLKLWQPSIHHNPVRGKWNLVNDFVLYPHSSAAFYELGTLCQFPLTHYAEILHGR